MAETSKLIAAFLVGMIIGAIAVSYTSLRAPMPGENVTLPTPEALPPRSAAAHIVAVAADTNEGIVGTAIVEILPGRGRVLVSTNPFIEPDTQESVAIAKDVAENLTGVSLASNDIIASFDLPLGNVSARLIGGPSAGAAVALAIAAAALNTSVREDIAITGRILPDGGIGSVSGILEKARAAGEAGMSIFIVPAGQANITYYEKTEERQRANGFMITRISYAPRTLSLNNYTQQWNMTSVEAENISEAAMWALVNFTRSGP